MLPSLLRYKPFILCLVFGLLLSLSLVACDRLNPNRPDQTNSPPQRTLTYGLTLLPSGFDPHINASSELGIPFMSVYDTLVYRHPQTRAFEAGLAHSWTISEDGTSYTFNLKEGVTFHDGQPFNAEAVGVNFDRITFEANASQKARQMLGPFYVGYTIDDPYTFTIILSAPYQPLLDALSQVYFGIASPLALANYRDGTYQWNQVGTGPYRLAEVVPGDRIVLERNPDYTWGPAFYTPTNPTSVERFVFRFFVDPTTRSAALQSDQVQLVGELPPIDVELLLGNAEINIYPIPIPGQPLQFIFNTERFPTSDANIRRALLYATNRAAIVDAIFAGQSPVAHGPISSTTDFYNPVVENLYPYNPGEAETLFRLARVADTDEDGILDQDGLPLEVRLIVPPWGMIPETAQAIAGQWRELGLIVEIEQVVNFPMLLERIAEGDYHLVAFYDFGLDPAFINSYYLTDGVNNYANYSNPQLDQLLTDALGATSIEGRASLYAAAQELIMREAVILPVREYVNLNGSTDSLDGIIFDAHGWWPLLPNFQWTE